MDRLSIRECDYLIGIWKICFHCETSIRDEDFGRLRSCGCLYHASCPVQMVRGSHSFCLCSLEFKQELVCNFLEKTFWTGRDRYYENVRTVYKEFMAQAFPNLMNEKCLLKLTVDECNHLMLAWKICFKCGTRIKAERYEDEDLSFNGIIDNCQCLVHQSCPALNIREDHPFSPCSLDLKQEVITNYVRENWNTGNIRKAYRRDMGNIFMSLEEKEIGNQLKKARLEVQLGKTRILELEKENANYQQKLKEGLLWFDRVEENAMMKKESHRLKGELEKIRTTEESFHQALARIKETRDKINRINARLAQSENEKKWKNMQAICDELKAKNTTLRSENERLKKEKNEQIEQITQQALVREGKVKRKMEKITSSLAQVKNERNGADQKWKNMQAVCDELEAKITTLGNENERLKQEQDKHGQIQQETQQALVREREIKIKLNNVTASLAHVENERNDVDQKWKNVLAVCDELEAKNTSLGRENQRLKKDDDKKNSQIEQILLDMENVNEDYRQKWMEIQEEYGKLKTMHGELEKNESLEKQKEKKTSEQNTIDNCDDKTMEECNFELEMDTFRLLFNELQTRTAKLGRMSRSKKNSRIRKELARKMAEATEISCEVEDETEIFLKKEVEKLQNALDELLLLESDVPSPSSTCA